MDGTNDLAAAFLAHQADKLSDLRARLTAAVRSLGDDGVNWRPNDASNSVTNLVLHLAGNFGERYGTQLSGEPSTRDRDAEFEDSEDRTAEELVAIVERIFEDARLAISSFPHERLLQTIEVRGRTQTLLELIAHSSAHASEHVGQALYVAKLRLGDGFPNQSIPRPAQRTG